MPCRFVVIASSFWDNLIALASFSSSSSGWYCSLLCHLFQTGGVASGFGAAWLVGMCYSVWYGCFCSMRVLLSCSLLCVLFLVVVPVSRFHWSRRLLRVPVFGGAGGVVASLFSDVDAIARVVRCSVAFFLCCARGLLCLRVLSFCRLCLGWRVVLCG
jgi:hypothetical protein